MKQYCEGYGLQVAVLILIIISVWAVGNVLIYAFAEDTPFSVDVGWIDYRMTTGERYMYFDFALDNQGDNGTDINIKTYLNNNFIGKQSMWMDGHSKGLHFVVVANDKLDQRVNKLVVVINAEGDMNPANDSYTVTITKSNNNV